MDTHCLGMTNTTNKISSPSKAFTGKRIADRFSTQFYAT